MYSAFNCNYELAIDKIESVPAFISNPLSYNCMLILFYYPWYMFIEQVASDVLDNTKLDIFNSYPVKRLNLLRTVMKTKKYCTFFDIFNI